MTKSYKSFELLNHWKLVVGVGLFLYGEGGGVFAIVPRLSLALGSAAHVKAHFHCY